MFLFNASKLFVCLMIFLSCTSCATNEPKGTLEHKKLTSLDLHTAAFKPNTAINLSAVRLSEKIKSDFPEYENKFAQLATLIEKDYKSSRNIDKSAEDFSRLNNDTVANPTLKVSQLLINYFNFGGYGYSGKRDSELEAAIDLAIQNAFYLQEAKKLSTRDNPGKYKPYMEVLKIVFLSMKKLTNEAFEQCGITSLRLYRGVRLLKSPTNNLHQLGIISSFSASKMIANTFAHPLENTKRGYVLEIELPIDRILSCAYTGFGTGSQEEFVVLGPSKQIDRFKIHPFSQSMYENGK